MGNNGCVKNPRRKRKRNKGLNATIPLSHVFRIEITKFKGADIEWICIAQIVWYMYVL